MLIEKKVNIFDLASIIIGHDLIQKIIKLIISFLKMKYAHSLNSIEKLLTTFTYDSEFNDICIYKTNIIDCPESSFPLHYNNILVCDRSQIRQKKLAYE